jgi:O-antigen ligase
MFAMLAINLVLTSSRGGWLGFLVGAVAAMVIYNKKLLYFLLAIPVPVIFIGGIRERFLSIFTLTSGTNLQRIKIWKTGLFMVKDNPVLGVGLGNSIYRYDEYVKIHPELNTDYSQFPLHNSYLKVWAETGIFGILLFIAILIYIITKVLKIYSSSRSQLTRGLSGGFFASLTGYMVMNVFDNNLFDPQTAVFFWLVFALIVSLERLIKISVEE